MDDQLPEGCVLRLDVYTDGVRVNLRDGMSRTAFAETLRMIAEAYENGAGIRLP